MPMSIEVVVAMQACARIGAVHSVVFGGFSAKSLQERIIDAGAVAVLTTQLLTPAGVLPLAFELEAASLEDACSKFPDAVKIAIEQAIEEAREMRREAASRMVVPEAGGGMGGPPGGGRIKL